jgi:hypothetical protein
MNGKYQVAFSQRISQEIKQTPEEYLPMLLEVVRLFRQTVTLKSAEDSFRQGWQEAVRGETMPISDLWVGIDDQ